jgi:hypothetical protein
VVVGAGSEFEHTEDSQTQSFCTGLLFAKTPSMTTLHFLGTQWYLGRGTVLSHGFTTVYILIWFMYCSVPTQIAYDFDHNEPPKCTLGLPSGSFQTLCTPPYAGSSAIWNGFNSILVFIVQIGPWEAFPNNA